MLIYTAVLYMSRTKCINYDNEYFIISIVFVPARGKISTTQYTRFQILTTWLLVSDVKEKQSMNEYIRCEKKVCTDYVLSE
jgi:hypothetical protein